MVKLRFTYVNESQTTLDTESGADDVSSSSEQVLHVWENAVLTTFMFHVTLNKRHKASVRYGAWSLLKMVRKPDLYSLKLGWWMWLLIYVGSKLKGGGVD